MQTYWPRCASTSTPPWPEIERMDYPPYVSTAQRRQKAAAYVAKQRKRGKQQPRHRGGQKEVCWQDTGAKLAGLPG